MMAFVLMIGAISVGLTFYNPRSASSASINDPATTEALAAVKVALIGYAVRRGGAIGNARPGELPCPDTDNDGWEETDCSTVGGRTAIGRVPWRTLGIPEPKDSAGETLWYAVAGTLRTRPANTANVNSNTRGNLEVRVSDGSAPLTTEAAAVIFAPGQAMGAQNRSSTQTAACATWNPANANVARNLCATNYLDATNGYTNATATGAFIAGVPSGTYNDRVLHLHFNEYLPAVEMRVGNELRNLLLAYRQRSICQCFPWADSWEYSGGIADAGVNRGRFPSVPAPEAWGAGAIPQLPSWVEDNDWHNLVFYSTSRAESAGNGASCWFCTASEDLTVDGSPVSALLFMPGPPEPWVNRAASDNLALYLEDPLNRAKAQACPGWNVEYGAVVTPSLLTSWLTSPPVVPASCDIYARPTSTAFTRDRLFTISVPSCAVSARALIHEATTAPCHTTGDGVRPLCQQHADALAMCTCSASAVAMVTEPCRNTLNPKQCRNAVTELLTCGL